MISRRLFLQLVSWSSVSALLWDPASAVALEEGQEHQQSAPEPEFDYRVSTVRGITDIEDWRAERTEEGIVLRWTTAFEYKIDHFVIEHQPPGQEETGNWEQFVSLNAEGTTLNAHEYRHVASRGFAPGTHRFRLKRVGEEGNTETTEAVSVPIGGFLTWRADDTADGITLRWETVFFERAPDEFVVEQQPSGQDEADWRVLGTVDATDDPSTPAAYRYEVEDLDPGGHRFRLQQVDEDGTTTYTEPVSVRAEGILEWVGQETEDGIELRWRTVTAKSERTFVIEHQKPRGAETDWTTLGRVTGEGKDETTYRYVARDLVPGEHRFRLKRVEPNGKTEYTDPLTAQKSMDTAVRLTPPSPNPVRTRATFAFAVRSAQQVTIKMYDVMGREVRTVYRGTPPAEENQTVRLQGDELAAGVYFVRLIAGDHVETRRITVVR